MAIDIAKVIEHTILKPDATAGHIEQLCMEAKDLQFFGVCIAPYWIPRASLSLKGSPTKIISVIGFPHGNTLTKVKAAEAAEAIEAGASEIDMVINIGALKSGDSKTVNHDIRSVATAVHQKKDCVLKVIIETALLTNEEKVLACKLSEEAGADFVKTSTGFSSSGATVSDVQLMKASVSKRVRVKAAGGIRDLDTALSMIKAGADRIGCSASVAIVEAARTKGTQI